ncbi:MAG: DUF364 domain-containing protein [Anaerolineales bacterium]|nr:DUF364 domain-containing protein [Anaerolineales bacterium]
MKLVESLLAKCRQGVVVDVRIGIHWTAVVADVDGAQHCGLASTLYERGPHSHEPDVPQAGKLIGLPGHELAELVHSEKPILASLGVAAMNALLPPPPRSQTDANAEDLLARHGKGKKVVLVGHFPFVERLKSRVGELIVLELFPHGEDLPATEAPGVIPQAEVVAITAMTLVNHTLESLLELCTKDMLVMVLGPSTPLHPIFYDWGVSILSGSEVASVEPVLKTISQGGNFRQVHRAGIKFVNMVKQEIAG